MTESLISPAPPHVPPSIFMGGDPAEGYTACYLNDMKAVSLVGEWIFHNTTYKIFTGITNTELQNHMTGESAINNGGTGVRGVLFSMFTHLLALILLIVVVSRLLHFFLRRLKMPQIVCQLIAGIVIFSVIPKPSKMSDDGDYGFLNPENRRVEHIVGSIGILYSLFIAAVKFDLSIIMSKPWEKKIIIISFSSVIVPFIVGSLLYLLQKEQLKSFGNGQFLFIVVYPFCATFPVTLTDILNELGLLNSEVGRLALSSSMIQFTVTYVLFDVPMIVYHQGQQSGTIYAFITLVSIALIFVFSVIVVRPYAQRIVRNTPLGTRVRDVHIFVIMLLVLALALVSDLTGYIFTDGPVMMGLSLPHGAPLGTALIDRVDLVSSELLLPIVFMHEGILIDWAGLKQNISQILRVEFVVLMMYIAKILTNMFAAVYCKMSLKDGFILGLVMNFRGLVEMLLLLSLCTERGFMNNTEFTALLLPGIAITVISVPLVWFYYKPGKGEKPDLRTVQYVDPREDLGIMSCFYDTKSVPTLLEFLESVSSQKSFNPISIYILHLVEIQACAQSSLFCHRDEDDTNNWAQMGLVHNHFISFEQNKRSDQGVTIVPYTSITPLKTMHRDVCSLVLDRNISFVVVPYPKKDSIADLETEVSMRSLVPMVLEQAPCSVGIMVYDGTTRAVMQTQHWQYHVGVIFWGGPDDREAIAVASRMARHPGVYLKIFYFVRFDLTEREREEDDNVIAEMLAANSQNNCTSITEIKIKNVEEAFPEFHALGDKYDLLIVGRRQERLLQMGEDLANWSESPELGVIGEMLATDHLCVANLLIVQQHTLHS